MQLNITHDDMLKDELPSEQRQILVKLFHEAGLPVSFAKAVIGRKGNYHPIREAFDDILRAKVEGLSLENDEKIILKRCVHLLNRGTPSRPVIVEREVLAKNFLNLIK